MASDRDDRWGSEDDRDRPGRGESVIDRAKERVNGPALGLILVGVASLVVVALNLIQYPNLDTQFDAQVKQVQDNPSLPADQKKAQVDMMNNLRGPVKTAFLPVLGVMALIDLLIVFAGVKMRALQSRGLVLTGSILAMIPCFTAVCCLIGLPIGIWAIIALGKPEVKAGFDAVARRAGGGGYDEDRV